MDIYHSSVETKHSTLNCAMVKGGPRTLVLLPGLSTKSLMPMATNVAMQYQSALDKYTLYLIEPASNPPANYTMQDMADDTMLALEKLDLRDIYMMGISAGGMLAQTLAARRTDLLKCLVLGSSSSVMTEQAKAIISKWSRLAKEGKTQELNKSFAANVYTASFYKNYGFAIMAWLKDATEAELKRFAILADCVCNVTSLDISQIKCPTLAICGDQDCIFSPEQTLEIARKTGGRSFIFKNYGHAVYDETPDYLRLVLKFFDEVS